LQQLNSDKDETIRRHVDTLERNDVIVARMTRSVTSLEESLAASRDQLADKERALAAKTIELESKTAECRQTQQLLDTSAEQVIDVKNVFTIFFIFKYKRLFTFYYFPKVFYE